MALVLALFPRAALNVYVPLAGFAETTPQPSDVLLRCHEKLAVSLLPGSICFTRSSPFAWQSFEEKIRSSPLITRNSIWDVPTLTWHGADPPLVIFMLSNGFCPAA